LSFRRFALERGDVEGFLHELPGFHESFRDCCTRREPREHFFRSTVGQFSPLERKSIEPMALEVEGGDVRGMQRIMSDDVWDEAQTRRIDHGLESLVANLRGQPGTRLCEAELAVPKTTVSRPPRQAGLKAGTWSGKAVAALIRSPRGSAHGARAARAARHSAASQASDPEAPVAP
jgi:DDE superfamily endonuclease